MRAILYTLAALTTYELVAYMSRVVRRQRDQAFTGSDQACREARIRRLGQEGDQA